MKHIGTTLSMLVLAGSLAGSAMAADNDAPVRAATGENYCNMRFPAMTQKSLASNHPQLKNAQTGDMIDYSGPCDESPDREGSGSKTDARRVVYVWPSLRRRRMSRVETNRRAARNNLAAPFFSNPTRRNYHLSGPPTKLQACLTMHSIIIIDLLTARKRSSCSVAIVSKLSTAGQLRPKGIIIKRIGEV